MPRTSPQRTASPAGSATAGGNYHTHALSRGLHLLELFSRREPPFTFTELHDESGLPKSTLVRLLDALAAAEFIMKVDDRPAYRLGHKVLTLAEAYVSSLDISSLAGRWLDELSGHTQQTSNIGVLDGDQVLHVCVRTPDRPLRFEQVAGARAAAYCTGLGKVLLASLNPVELPAYFKAEPFPKLTQRTITTWAALDAELRRTSRRHYAIDDNEHSVGLRCVAVPLEHDGETLAALSVSGPSGEFGTQNQRRYLDALRHTADRLVSDSDVVAALGHIHRSLRRWTTPEQA